jgi:NitT/TauT family transport system ATP-binding protein
VNAPFPSFDAAERTGQHLGNGIAVKIDHVQKIFETRDGDEVIALEGADLAVSAGEFVAVVGPSGCGKSTLLSMIAGIESPTSGRILVDNHPLSGPNPRTSVVFQNDYLLPWRNIIDNVLLPIEIKRLDTKLYRERADALLTQVGLAGFGGRFPSELSGGMRQRVAICRAVIQEPGLLLMDEPFGALDALTREQMIMDLQNLWLRLKNTVVFITHGIDEAVFLADRVIVMSPRPGRIDMQLEIDLPRPRKWNEIHSNPGFTDAVAQVRHRFEEQGVLKAG